MVNYSSSKDPKTPIYTKKGVRIAESWFDQELKTAKADIMILKQRYNKVGLNKFQEKATLIEDLNDSSDNLWSKLSKGNKYEINRARKRDLIKCTHLDSPSDKQIADFINFFNHFAMSKGLPTLDAKLYQIYRNAHSFKLSYAEYHDEVIVYHSYYATAGDTCRLLNSASLYREKEDKEDRALVGRANRLLHWEDYLWFKANEYKRYDWGGFHTGNNPELLNINAFKQSFGGVITKVYEGKKALTVKGKLAGILHGLIRKR